MHGSTMPQHVGYIALLVRGYDEAISYFVEKLGFTVAEDTDLGGGKRWVLVAPPGQSRLGLCWQRPYLRTNWLASGIRPVGRLLRRSTDDKTSICAMSSTTKISRSGGCRRFLLGGCVRLVLHTRSVDAKLDRLGQARGNEVGFRAIP